MWEGNIYQEKVRKRETEKRRKERHGQAVTEKPPLKNVWEEEGVRDKWQDGPGLGLEGRSHSPLGPLSLLIPGELRYQPMKA